MSRRPHGLRSRSGLSSPDGLRFFLEELFGSQGA